MRKTKPPRSAHGGGCRGQPWRSVEPIAHPWSAEWSSGRGSSSDLGGLVLDDSELVDGGHLAEHGEQLQLGHVLGHLAHEELHALLHLLAAASLHHQRRFARCGGLLAVLCHCPPLSLLGFLLLQGLLGSSSSSCSSVELLPPPSVTIVEIESLHQWEERSQGWREGGVDLIPVGEGGSQS
jgi:hypothetical protein